MLFLVYEECRSRRGDHLLDCIHCRLEWLATVKLLQKKGQVAAHFDFSQRRGGATVYRAASRDELDGLLASQPNPGCVLERRIGEVRSLEEAIEELSHRIVPG